MTFLCTNWSYFSHIDRFSTFYILANRARSILGHAETILSRDMQWDAFLVCSLMPYPSWRYDTFFWGRFNLKVLVGIIYHENDIISYSIDTMVHKLGCVQKQKWSWQWKFFKLCTSNFFDPLGLWSQPPNPGLRLIVSYLTVCYIEVGVTWSSW